MDSISLSSSQLSEQVEEGSSLPRLRMRFIRSMPTSVWMRSSVQAVAFWNGEKELKPAVTEKKVEQ